MLLISIVLALQTPIDSVAVVTRDIPNFWRAYDSATGKADAEQARLFRTVYLQPGSPGLRDWMRLRLMNRDTVRARMIASGWTAARLDSLSRDSLERASAPFAEQSGAEELVRALRAYPRYYAAVRSRTLAVDRGNGGTERHAHGDGAERERPRYAARRAPRLGAERFPHAYFRIARWPRRARGGAYPAEAHAPGPARHPAAPRARRRHRRFPLRARGGTVGGEHTPPDLRPRARTRRLGRLPGRNGDRFHAPHLDVQRHGAAREEPRRRGHRLLGGLPDRRCLLRARRGQARCGS